MKKTWFYILSALVLCIAIYFIFSGNSSETVKSSNNKENNKPNKGTIVSIPNTDNATTPNKSDITPEFKNIIAVAKQLKKGESNFTLYVAVKNTFKESEDFYIKILDPYDKQKDKWYHVGVLEPGENKVLDINYDKGNLYVSLYIDKNGERVLVDGSHVLQAP